MADHCIVVIAGEPSECYYRRSGIDETDRELFRSGPKEFVEFVRDSFLWKERRPVVEAFNSWEHYGVADRGVFVDESKKLLAVYVGDEASFSPDVAHAALMLISAKWKGWDVRWFPLDWQFVAEELGVPRTVNRKEEPERLAERTVLSVPGPGWIRAVHSSVSYRTVVAYRMGMRSGIVQVGKPLADVVGRGPSLADDEGRWKDELRLDETCMAGLHLDFDTHTYSFYDHWEPVDRLALAPLFPEWQAVQLWSSRDFERIVGPGLVVDRPSDEEVLRTVVQALARERLFNPEPIADLIRDLGYEELAAEVIGNEH